jgi:hypothetical protein
LRALPCVAATGDIDLSCERHRHAGTPRHATALARRWPGAGPARHTNCGRLAAIHNATQRSPNRNAHFIRKQTNKALALSA